MFVCSQSERKCCNSPVEVIELVNPNWLPEVTLIEKKKKVHVDSGNIVPAF